MDLFRSAIRSPKTRASYESWLSSFAEFAKAEPAALVRLGKQDPKRLEAKILAYVGDLKEREFKAGTIRARLAPVKLLLVMNDVERINWKKVGKVIPPMTVAEDRAPTLEEVRAIAGDTDYRVKVPVLFMCSGGLRAGAFAGMKVKHVEPVKFGDGVAAAWVKVYPGSREEYRALVSGEAWAALESYLAHRRENGEKVTGESPLLRNRYVEGEAGTAVTPMSQGSLDGLLHRRYRRLGFRKGSREQKRGQKRERYEFAAAHGFRKFFKTRAEAVMKPLNVETLLGHETGLAGRYYRPRESEILEDYLKAVPSLAILDGPGEEGRRRLDEMGSRLQQLEEENAKLVAVIQKVDREAAKIVQDAVKEEVARTLETLLGGERKHPAGEGPLDRILRERKASEGQSSKETRF